MKAKVIAAILVVSVSLQAAGMGHPHNLFAARKQIKAKRTVSSQTLRSDSGRSKTTACAKATLLTTAAIWRWFQQKEAN